ncbi:MAG: hypothetical protein IJY65_00065 [Clostridia bacterium]|nr:hypothetical protein [Clostridia bacterium]
MINELSIRPKPQSKLADRVFYSLLLVAFAIIAASYLAERGRGLISLAAVIVIVAALSVYSRFMAGEYSYDITYDSQDTPLFVVRKFSGKRATTLCNVELSAIRSVDILEDGKDTERTSKEARRYNYSPTLGKARRAKLTVKTRYESSVILIEGTDEFFALLSAYANEAREIALRDDE